MSIDRIVLAFTGTVIFLSVALGHYHHPYWVWLTVFVAVNLVQAAFTGFCPLAKFLKRVGISPGAEFN